MTGKRICTCCKEDRRIVGRGLCARCYMAASRAVSNNETTWAKLERQRLTAPLKRTPLKRLMSKK
jgi:hypothetical protein